MISETQTAYGSGWFRQGIARAWSWYQDRSREEREAEDMRGEEGREERNGKSEEQM